MTTQNATARPWIMNVWTTGRRTIESHGHGHPIAEVLLQHDEAHKANAELIVRAVNNHDSLLEACKSAFRGDDNYFLKCKKAIQQAESV